MTHTGRHDGAVVTAHHALAEYMPELAVRIARHLGADQNKALADLMKLADGLELFPQDMKKGTREMRVARLFAGPVQVDDLVMTLVTREKRHMYDKTRSILTRRGVLPPPATPAQVAPAPSESTFGAALGSAARIAATLPPGFVETTLRDLTNLRACMERIENLLVRQQPIVPLTGSTTAPAPTFAPFSAAPLAPVAPVTPVSDRDPRLKWHPFPDKLQWHARYGKGPRLSRPLVTLNLEVLEENQARALAAMGQVPAPRGTMVEPEWSMDDCAARARRAFELARVFVSELKLPPPPEAPDPTDWSSIGANVAAGHVVLRRLLERHRDLWEEWRHPELVVDVSEEEEA